MYSSTLSLTSALNGGGGGQRLAPAALPSGNRPGTHCIGGWVGWSGRGRKISPLPGFDPRTVQPLANRSNDFTIPALYLTKVYLEHVIKEQHILHRNTTEQQQHY